MSVIRVEAAEFAYGGMQVLRGLSLDLAQPGVIGLTGPQGSGKSTLLRLLAGLLRPQGGEIRVLGYSPACRYPVFLEQVTLVSATAEATPLSPAEVERIHAPFYPAYCPRDYDEYLSVFELSRRRSLATVCARQRKAAALAFALACHTPVLLVDEPTQGLDRIAQQRLQSLLRRPEHQDRYVLLASSQAQHIEVLLDHVVILDGGDIRLSAPMQALHRTLRMQWSSTAHDGSDPIHVEEVNGRSLYVVANPEDSPGGIKLELLVKALQGNRQGVLDALAAQSRSPANLSQRRQA